MTIIECVQAATPFATDKENMKLMRVIGTTDIEGKGVQHAIHDIDPFLFLDDASVHGELPTTFSKHPHTGLTAVSYLLEGTAHAWDNLHGATRSLNRAGGIYCINAGKGVVHGEAPVEGVRNMRLLQLWFNPGIYDVPLPTASYQLYQPHELPTLEDKSTWIKVLIGSVLGKTSPLKTSWPIQYLHLKVGPKSDYSFPLQYPDWQGFIYVVQGEGIFGDHISGKTNDCLVLKPGSPTELSISNPTAEPLEFVLALGKPHNKPFIKLLGHGGAIVASSEDKAREQMRTYERNPENFGK